MRNLGEKSEGFWDDFSEEVWTFINIVHISIISSLGRRIYQIYRIFRSIKYPIYNVGMFLVQ